MDCRNIYIYLDERWERPEKIRTTTVELPLKNLKFGGVGWAAEQHHHHHSINPSVAPQTVREVQGTCFAGLLLTLCAAAAGSS
jgi:hypothetical protein